MTTRIRFHQKAVDRARKTAGEKYREVIDSSPTRIEVIDGRAWKIVTLPPGGELWRSPLSATYYGSNGDRDSTDPTAAPGEEDLLGGGDDLLD